ncbi:ChaN family lipoprotein [Phaeobacter gallaeciensis]|uniref:ChaN family lipoprotein n=1 Tax=Phaeobacter gallaeciensis TaxID=60890 RepID=UPI000BBC4DF5|nr:ChaN family lipoprotein [Phaeobacter gallaeciensis]ATF17469.1 putative iron-regulated protein [Phaeobacter gallaeciensis]ATF21578.1 putative iron-regulated protein [Phaeobacter gallaeciensis]
MKNQSNFINKGATQIGRAFSTCAAALRPMALGGLVSAAAIIGTARADQPISQTAPTAQTATSVSGVVPRLTDADVVFLGEVHDNPAHHTAQAEIIAALEPAAVVWEMITPAQAAGLTPDLLQDGPALAEALDWAQSGWPEFTLYQPVFAAGHGAAQVGALVPRAETRRAMKQGVARFFGAEAAAYGLTEPLPEAEQAAREADQLANHCNAMPAEMLPVLVDLQRLRDAALARGVVTALDQLTDAIAGQPRAQVVVITGNGHARQDRGAPVALRLARPDLKIVALGQSEGGQIDGVFDVLLDARRVSRHDPCLAFQ